MPRTAALDQLVAALCALSPTDRETVLEAVQSAFQLAVTETDRERLLNRIAPVPRLSWEAEINAAKQGMHGTPLTDDQIAVACRDYVGNGHLETPTLRHFRAFLTSAGRAPKEIRQPAPNGADAAWESVLALLPDWHQRTLSAERHQALPDAVKRGLSAIGGFSAIAATSQDKRTWLKRDFVAAFTVS